jgi:hypothetical protein
MSTSREPIAWLRIEALMLKSWQGTTLSAEEQREINKAYKRDAKEYGARHQRLVREQIAERRRRGF